ncbi:hypothetical protein [Winogradskyella flava]|uniref:Tetratricopeptide repeat-containing protein n=1 Tax=Winogradskyella flava TaxID=1884876 RepID=A0A842IQG2_9FLAO|nr:hypothetical protein [Winogradskyella flava]MBC2845240.1 hypothetical protein [Winogradskyella flava]
MHIPRWLEYARIKHKHEINTTTERDIKAYNFLTKSGEKRLKLGNYKGALSEFKLAHNIQPNSTEVNQLLLEVISILCEKDDNYCEEYDSLKL